MNTKHTPEPWHVGCQNDYPFIINQPPRPSTDDIVDIPDVIVIAKPAEIPGNAATVVANAERIVACVNALAGLNPEAIKDVVEALEAVNSSSRTYPHGIAKLMSALDQVEAALAKLKQTTP
jgi:hypothetical protein